MAKGRGNYDSVLNSRYPVLFDSLSRRITDPDLHRMMLSLLVKLKSEPLAAPDFSLMSITGEEVSLHDFLGKIVYLYFWSTTCAPCVKEFPFAAELQSKFAKEDVIFLYVALESDREKVKKFVEYIGGHGIYLIAPKGFVSDVAKDYGVNSIPRYYVIDRDGKIISSDAPRPSLHPEEIIENALRN
ncbi:MAG: redoxin domain-containing protein [Bacteroidetes bacterium]|nr:redoxin domain-containing protein [Bacteroidota bacterium]